LEQLRITTRQWIEGGATAASRIFFAGRHPVQVTFRLSGIIDDGQSFKITEVGLC
jgi:hypothetical protein